MVIEQSLVDRMVAVLRDQVEKTNGLSNPTAGLREAREIVALLPKPVDPLLIKARQIVVDNCNTKGFSHWVECVIAGDHDDSDRVRIALAALRARDAA